MRTALCILLLSCLAVPAKTQVAPGHAVVATNVGGQTQLLDVDLANGAVVVLPRFPADTSAPLAVAFDPIDGRTILAIDRGGGLTFLHGVGGGLIERFLSSVPGTVTDLVLADGGDVFAAVGGPGGGIWRIPRNGGSSTLVVAIPRASALSTFGIGSQYAWVAVSGDNALMIDPEARLVDLTTGATIAGPYVYTGYQPRGLTGIADLPTGVPRELLTDEGGNVSLSFGFMPPTRLQILPQLPPGATRVLVMQNAFDGVVLGGSAHPFLKKFSGYQTPQNWVMLAGPLPGDPVDFDLAPPAGASVTVFGRPCPPSLPGTHLQALGAPDLGNAAFALQLMGVPSTPSALVLGASDQLFAGQPLPIFLPGGCQLLVSVLALLPNQTNGAGTATQALPVPADPALRGSRVFAQWLHVPPSGIVTSSGATLLLW
jgi:hypothetical protein